MIARAAALVLHFDVGLILFRMSMYRKRDVNGVMLMPGSCLPYFDFSAETDAVEWHHSVWYVYSWIQIYQFLANIVNLDKNITFHKRSLYPSP